MNDLIGLAKKSILFQGITSEEMEEMVSCLSPRNKTFKKHQYIYKIGDNISNIGLVKTGSVLAVEDDWWGNRNIIRRFSVGEFFGEAYALSSKPINFSILANEETEIIFLDVSSIMHTCKKNCPYHNKLINNFVSLLAEKNIALKSKIENVTKRTTREKILSYLLKYSSKLSSKDFDIPFDRQQFADYLCVDRSALSSELGKLKKERIIDFKKNHFHLE